MSASPRQPVVLLTGASAGVGLALSRILVRGVGRVILTARASSLPRFQREGIQASDRIWIRPLDITRPDQCEAVVREADLEWGGVDVLINNAGVAYRAVCEHVTDEDRWEQLSVNYRGPMELIRLVLPRMRERRDGRIINVSSVSGMMAMPTMGLYSASKFALEGATEALWYEVKPFGIKVTLVQPGFIHSESFRNTRYTRLSRNAMVEAGNPYRQHYDQMSGFIARFMERTRATPEDVAMRIFQVMTAEHPPLRVAGTLDAHIFGWLRRMLPRKLYHVVLYRCLPGIRHWGLPPSASSNAQGSDSSADSPIDIRG